MSIVDRISFLRKIVKNTDRIDATKPDTMKFLLISNLIIQNGQLWQMNVRNDAFYTGMMDIIRKWVSLSDEELKVLHPNGLPIQVDKVEPHKDDE
jgi:hypothetical protein